MTMAVAQHLHLSSDGRKRVHALLIFYFATRRVLGCKTLIVSGAVENDEPQSRGACVNVRACYFIAAILLRCYMHFNMKVDPCESRGVCEADW
mmetsp:Transcript_28576/g.69594  ORF Transcript_28576/g.69594 Transcript_28576/m.69594 type:complete len:93 (-) Transcript_28576:447-725(-)